MSCKDKNASYESPFCTRYASPEMQRIFSRDVKFSTWRKLWVALAESEAELGLDITQEQIDELKAHIYDINYDVAEAREREVRHDVMAHIFAYGVQCPKAKPIIHLGATSCFVGDNTDIILMREALNRVRSLLVSVMRTLCDFADKYKALPTLAYTHFQPAQPTTVGKRAALWLQDLAFDLEAADRAVAGLKLLGCRGATGTAASFRELFGGDRSKVAELERKIAEKMGFDGVYDVSGQTYSRKVDYTVMTVLSGIAQSAYKFSSDIRLLSHLKEVDEPFEEKQVGSSAMAYKRNPMRSERIASLARYVIANALNPALTASAQWFERTLDDSANKRISIPEAFLAVDAILALYKSVISGLTVYPKMIERHLAEELPFIATENILMYCVKRGGDRQALHEAIREHSVAAGRTIKAEGVENDLIARIAADRRFGLTEAELAKLLDPEKYTGFAREQTEEYVAKVRAMLGGYDLPEADSEVRV
jgi:adenylosuccinate lyase